MQNNTKTTRQTNLIGGVKMFELATGYVIGMITGYLIFRRSVIETNADLKEYIKGLIDNIYGPVEED